MVDKILAKLGDGPGGCLLVILFLGVVPWLLCMLLPIGATLAVLIGICTYWYKLFMALPTAGRIVQVIASLIAADYFNTHRDNFFMLLCCAGMLYIFYAMAKTDTYHGQEDDFHNDN